jgi:hypothetical protein
MIGISIFVWTLLAFCLGMVVGFLVAFAGGKS